MKLIPLKQWICDECGELIEKPEDGYIQFHYDENNDCDDIIIVHHYPKSPLKDKRKDGCYRYRFDLDLKSHLGEDGIAWMLSLLDWGPHIEREFKRLRTINIRKWVETFRRLHTPYYEEARLYWDLAEQDGYFDGANEVWPYIPDNLKTLIDRYGK